MVKGMTVYFAVIFLIALFSILYSARCKTEKTRNTLLCWTVFFLLFLLLTLRNENMGADLLNKDMTGGYLVAYDELADKPWGVIFDGYLNYEAGYILLNKLVALLSGGNRQIFLAVCALGSMLPVAYMIYCNSDTPAFSFLIYMGLPVFLLLYSGLRQSLAIGLTFLSVRYIQKRKPIPFILLILAAAQFHYSAYLFLIAYPIYYLRMNTSLRVVSVFSLPVVFLLRYPLFSILSKLLKQNAAVEDNGAITLFLVFFAIYFFCFIFTNESEEQNGYINLFFLACFCQAFGGVNSIALRMGYYFMMPLVLLLPKVDGSMRVEQERKLAKIVILACFVLYGLYAISSSKWAEANPYYWFWETV